VYALQPLALPNVSVHTFRALHTYMCTAQLFCLVFSQEFNIMSAHFLHQVQAGVQKIDSREGLF